MGRTEQVLRVPNRSLSSQVLLPSHVPARQTCLIDCLKNHELCWFQEFPSDGTRAESQIHYRAISVILSGTPVPHLNAALRMNEDEDGRRQHCIFSTLQMPRSVVPCVILAPTISVRTTDVTISLQERTHWPSDNTQLPTECCSFEAGVESAQDLRL